MNVENLLAREHSDLDPRLREMLDEFPKFREEILPSKYWEELNKRNLKQLSDSSYENFSSSRSIRALTLNILNHNLLRSE